MIFKVVLKPLTNAFPTYTVLLDCEHIKDVTAAAAAYAKAHELPRNKCCDGKIPDPWKYAYRAKTVVEILKPSNLQILNAWAYQAPEEVPNA